MNFVNYIFNISQIIQKISSYLLFKICLSVLFAMAQCAPQIAHPVAYGAHPVAYAAHHPVVYTVPHVVTKPVTYTHTVNAGVLTHVVHGGFVDSRTLAGAPSAEVAEA